MPNDSGRRLYLIALAFVLAAGIFLRLPVSLFSGPGAPLAALSGLHPNPQFEGIGFDENLYRGYVNGVIAKGLLKYSDIVDEYIEVQKTLTGSILPPMRFLYIGTAYLWHSIFGSEALAALHNVASFFSMLALLLGTLFAWRLKGPAAALGVAALMAFAPTQLHMSQHALVDGFFAFWALLALWLLWENLRAPQDWRWLIPYTLALALMVITKENSAFVYAAVLVILAANQWARWGTVTREMLACTFIGPLLGFVILVFLAGGLETLRTTYTLSVSKNYQLTYAILTGDGPWHRYLVDLMLMSPLILCLAISAGLAVLKENKALLFLTGFVFFSYLIMCNVRYGMNLRYTTIWDFPLRALAIAQLSVLAGAFGSRKPLGMILLLAGVCAHELHQYVVYFKDGGLYELVTEGLLRAVKILK